MSKEDQMPEGISWEKCNGWSIRELKLPREEMLEAIATLQSVPKTFRSAYMDQVRLVPKEFLFIRFDAICAVHRGKLVQHSDASGF
jgi:hypothetical protein